MTRYKYSCPYCGQHIEYTDGYCGKQMLCPMCQQTIVFPAIPPGSLSPSLRVSRPAEERPRKKWKLDSIRMVAALRQFEHWNVVGQCLIPFLILGGALYAASILRSKPVEQPVAAAPQPVEPGTWEKMTQLAKVEQAMQDQVRWVSAAYANNLQAEQGRTRLHQQSGGHPDATALKRADQECAHAANALAAARQSFDKALSHYRDLGGTVDYRGQLPQ